jgi:hypothetical protein
MVVAAGVLAGCANDVATSHDARAIDAPPDTTLDAGQCNAASAAASGQLFLAGEYVDWTSVAPFCGILHATWQVHGDLTRVDITPPNGRVQLCLTDAPTTQIDITPPPGSESSQCTVPMSPYTIPGTMIATKAAIETGDLFSTRAITTAELPTFFTAQGLGTFDPTKAHVFIHEEGTTPRSVSITPAHGTAQAFDGTTWAAGTTGVNVYFPNVDVTVATTDVTVTGGAIGTTTIPLVAGTFTYLTVIAN